MASTVSQAPTARSIPTPSTSSRAPSVKQSASAKTDAVAEEPTMAVKILNSILLLLQLAFTKIGELLAVAAEKLNMKKYVSIIKFIYYKPQKAKAIFVASYNLAYATYDSELWTFWDLYDQMIGNTLKKMADQSRNAEKKAEAAGGGWLSSLASASATRIESATNLHEQRAGKRKEDEEEEGGWFSPATATTARPPTAGNTPATAVSNTVKSPSAKTDAKSAVSKKKQ